jgi:hypothetical protein
MRHVLRHGRRGRGTVLGFYCVVGEDVRLGARCMLGHHVVLHPGTWIGDDVRIDDHAVIGSSPCGRPTVPPPRNGPFPPPGWGALHRGELGGDLCRRRARGACAGGGPGDHPGGRDGGRGHDRGARGGGGEPLHGGALLQARDQRIRDRLFHPRGPRLPRPGW